MGSTKCFLDSIFTGIFGHLCLFLLVHLRVFSSAFQRQAYDFSKFFADTTNDCGRYVYG